MAGLVPAIYVFASHRYARRGADARIKSRHDGLVGIIRHLNKSGALVICSLLSQMK